MVDTVGEHRSGYRPQDSETAKALQEKKGPSRAWRAAHKLGIASFVTSLGLLGAAGAGHSPTDVAEKTVDIASDATEATVNVAQDTVGGTKEAFQRLDRDIRTGSPVKTNNPR